MSQSLILSGGTHPSCSVERNKFEAPFLPVPHTLQLVCSGADQGADLPSTKSTVMAHTRWGDWENCGEMCESCLHIGKWLSGSGDRSKSKSSRITKAGGFTRDSLPQDPVPDLVGVECRTQVLQFAPRGLSLKNDRKLMVARHPMEITGDEAGRAVEGRSLTGCELDGCWGGLPSCRVWANVTKLQHHKKLVPKR